MAKTIYTMWKRCEADYAALPAVRWLVKKNVQERSYGELAAAVTGIKKGFAAEGFSHKQIALIGTSSPEWITAYMSVVSSDNTAVPLDAALPLGDLIDLVSRCDSEGVFLDAKFAAAVPAIKQGCPKVRKIWMLSGETPEGTESVDELINAGAGTPENEPPKEEDICMIVYTSGTTGKSKGVMLTQSNLYCNVEAIVYDKDPGLVFLCNGHALFLPFSVWIVVAMYVIFGLLTRKTAFGLFIESVGNNERASRYAGIEARRIKWLTYVICGFCAGMAGLLAASNIKCADSNNAGLNLELDAILATVIGGTSMAGGRFFLSGSLVGAILIQTLTTTMYMKNVSPAIVAVPKAMVVIIVCLLQSPVFRAKVLSIFASKAAKGGVQ